jgi:hypothetical protein
MSKDDNVTPINQSVAESLALGDDPTDPLNYGLEHLANWIPNAHWRFKMTPQEFNLMFSSDADRLPTSLEFRDYLLHGKPEKKDGGYVDIRQFSSNPFVSGPAGDDAAHNVWFDATSPKIYNLRRPVDKPNEGIFRKHVYGKPNHFTFEEQGFSFKGVIDSIINNPDARLNILVTGDVDQKPTYEQMREYILAKDKSLDVLNDIKVESWIPKVLWMDPETKMPLDALRDMDPYLNSHIAPPTLRDTSPWVSTVKSHLRTNIDPSHIVHNTMPMPPRADMRLPYPIIRFSEAERKMIDNAKEIFKNLFEPFAMAFREETTVQYLGREEQRRAKTTQKLKQAGYVPKAATGPKKHGDRNAVQFVREVKPHPLLKGIIKKTES